jgi:hypothetical protein
MWCLSFCAWLIAFNVPRSIHVFKVKQGFTLLRLNDIPYQVDSTLSLAIHWLMDTWMVCMSWLLWTVLL